MPVAYAARLIATCLALSMAAAVARPAPATAVNANSQPSRGCADADLTPTVRTLPRVRRAMLCLINARRATAGRRQLTANVRLRLAATRYTRLMVERRCFGHECPGGATFVDRIVNTHYVGRHPKPTLGETIGWGMGSGATAAAQVSGLMRSTEHRRIVLHPRFRAAGVGIVVGAPRGGVMRSDSATFAIEFGVLR